MWKLLRDPEGVPTTADKTRTFENIARLRRAERETPENRDIPLVRASLEQELVETVSQRLAAKLLGISHTGLRRWVTSGDIPIVDNRRGKEGIPVSALLDLCEEVEGQRRSGRRHVVEPGMAAARARARDIRASPRTPTGVARRISGAWPTTAPSPNVFAAR